MWAGVIRTSPCGMETTQQCARRGLWGCGWRVRRQQTLAPVSATSEDLTGCPVRPALKEPLPLNGPSRSGSGRSLSVARGVRMCAHVEIVSWL